MDSKECVMQRDTGFMDWVDRVREQANFMAERAQDAQYVGQEQWHELQQRHHIDDLLHELGAVVYEQQTLGESRERSNAVDAIVRQIHALRNDLDVIDLRDPVAKTAN